MTDGASTGDGTTTGASERGPSVVRSEERLAVGVVRTPVERVRVHRDVVVEEVTHVVQVRREVLRIEREPLDPAGGAAAAVEPPRGAPGVVEVVLREERPVVGSEVVPVERVRVSVVRHEQQVVVADDVRVERVEVVGPGEPPTATPTA